MMSYLWILLIGSLLATSAKAQDDTAPTEDAADPAAPAPEPDAAPEAIGEPEADIGTEDASPPDSQPDADLRADIEDAAAPAEEDAATDSPTDNGADADAAAEESVAVEATDGGDAVDPPAVDPPAAEETDTPAAEETETDAPAAEETDTHAPPADGDQASETSTADPKVEPALDSELDHPEADNAETEQSTLDTPKEESDTDDQAPPATDVTELNKEEEAIDPAANEDTSEPEVEDKAEPEVKTDDVVDVPIDGGFDLADALDDGDSAVVDQPQPGKSRSIGSDGVSAGAAGSEDNSQPKEGNSGSLAGILSGVVLSAVGAVTGYFAYQKKKLCFKNRQEADPEAAHKTNAAEADPQVSSNLLS